MTTQAQHKCCYIISPIDIDNPWREELVSLEKPIFNTLFISADAETHSELSFTAQH